MVTILVPIILVLVGVALLADFLVYLIDTFGETDDDV